ncbi:hypothetical protein SVAN01_02934 [Stagonosporopsis vannaccii]|nr:hypothetical protein SVAN01_02934 [Stagonosporopsis vannaccii]
MAWISRYGKKPDDLTPLKAEAIRFKHILAGFVFLVLFGSSVACLPLTVIFVPKPQLIEYMPKGIHCATCDEIWQHNRDLFKQDDMFCYGKSNYVSLHASLKKRPEMTMVQNRSTNKEGEVMFTEEKRCWTIKKGHDEWMRPLPVTNEETTTWDKAVRTMAIRGGSWP